MLTCALLAAGALLAPQDAASDASLGFTTMTNGLAYRVVDVPDATHAAIVAAVRVGAWHDPAGKTGLAHVVSVVLGLAQAERPEAERWTVTPSGPATYLTATCPRADVRARTEEMLRLLLGDLKLSDDVFDRARAMAVLRADDFQELIPGPRQVEVARRLTAAGTPAGKQFFGVPEEMRSITRAEVEAWIAARFRPAHTSLVVLGAATGTGVDELLRDAGGALEDARTPTAAAEPTVHDTAPPILREAEHPKLRGPFATVVIKAPPPDGREWLPFLVAMGVVNARCHATFGPYRGREPEAGLPYFWFNYRRGEGFAMLSRRGPDEASADGPCAELRVLLRRLRTQAPALDEVARATLDVASSLMLPPYGQQLADMARYPQLLGPRAEVLAASHVLGWSATLPADVGKVLVNDVFAVLQARLADDNLTWLTLTAPPSPLKR